MNAIGQLIYLALWLFIVLLFVRFVVEWVHVFARSWSPSGPLLIVLEGVYTVTDPPIKFFRRFIPPLRIGGIGLDLSFMIVLIICYLLLSIVRGLLL